MVNSNVPINNWGEKETKSSAEQWQNTIKILGNGETVCARLLASSFKFPTWIILLSNIFSNYSLLGPFIWLLGKIMKAFVPL